MAVVQELTISGATVRIHDDYYRGISADEAQRRREKLNRVINQIWRGWAEREIEKQGDAT